MDDVVAADIRRGGRKSHSFIHTSPGRVHVWQVDPCWPCRNALLSMYIYIYIYVDLANDLCVMYIRMYI